MIRTTSCAPRHRRVIVLAVVLAVSACDSPDSVGPYARWFVELRGEIRELDGSPVKDAAAGWEHWTPICDEASALEQPAPVVADTMGRYQTRIGVETADGCFAFTAYEPLTGRTSPTTVRSAVDIPLRQGPPYDTIVIDLTLPPLD